MRRRERAIQERAAIEEILSRATVCHLGMCDGQQPYVVPVCHVYRDGCLYFHSATAGRKVRILEQNPAVCFQVDVDHELLPADRPCRWAMRYRSVIGFGRASFVSDPHEKIAALDALMERHGGHGGSAYAPDALEKVLIVRIDVEHMTGKQAGYS